MDSILQPSAAEVEEDPSLREMAVKAVQQYDSSSGSESEEESDYEDNSFEDDDDEEDGLVGRIEIIRSNCLEQIGNKLHFEHLLKLFRSGHENSAEAQALLARNSNGAEA